MVGQSRAAAPGRLAAWHRGAARTRRAGTAAGSGLLLCGVLLGAAACGGGGHPASSTFVPKGSEAPVSPQPSGSASGVPPLASFKFGPGVHFDFGPLPSDPRQAAAARVDEDFQLAYYYAIYSDARDMTVLSYISGNAPSVRTADITAVDQNRSESFRGTTRFYDIRVVPVPGAPSDLTVQACVDDSRMFSTSRSTGKIVPGQSTAPDKSVFLASDTLAPHGGSWKIVATDPTFYPHGAAKECYP